MEAKQQQWKDDIAFLKTHDESYQLHQLLPIIRRSLLGLQRGLVDLTAPNFQSDIETVLDACRRIDEAAREKSYRDQLGTMILDPLLNASGNSKAFVKNYLLTHLKFGKYGSHTHPLISDPTETLYALHHNKVVYIQNNPEQYEESALVIRLIEYWRELKVDDDQRYRTADVSSIIDLCGYLIKLACETPSTVKQNELRRMILLIQMLFEDHPQFDEVDWISLGRRECHCPLLCDYKDELAQSRSVFYRESDGLSAQLEHTSLVIGLLKKMLSSIIPLLGAAPCDIAVCALGSTSRFDRRPYSDLELVVFHNETEKTNDARKTAKLERLVDKYVYYILSFLELMIVKLSETHDMREGGYAGFHFDSSSHPIQNRLCGTPERILRRFVSPQGHIHPWLSESFYSLLSPLLIHPGEFGGDGLIQRYENLLHQYLRKSIFNNSQYSLAVGLAELPEEEMEVGTIYIHFKSNDDEDSSNFSVCYQIRDISGKVFRGQIPSYKLKISDPSLLQDAGQLQKLLPRILNYTNKIKHTRPIYDTVNFKGCLDELRLDHQKDFETLEYHQGIALVCLYDVLVKSVQAYDNKKELIDVKQVFYKPLAYCAMNLKHYFGFHERSPFAIMRKYAQACGNEAIAIEKMWVAALSFIVKVQIKLHLDQHAQNEHILFTLESLSDKQLWSGLELLYEGIIRPLFTEVKKTLAGEAVPFQKTFSEVLKSYLNYRRLWIENWTKKGLDRDWLITSPLIAVLASYPDSSGWSPLMDQTMRKLSRELGQLSQAGETSVKIEGIPSEPNGCYLSTGLVESCFDLNGNFKGDKEFSSTISQVKAIECEGKQWFVKVKVGNDEGLMGREYAAMIAHLLMGGEPQIALGWPLCLTFTSKGVAKKHFAWISEAVLGVSLADVMLSNMDKLKPENLDITNFTQLFIFTFLMCPEDAQPENFRMKVLANQKQGLINFDYGHSFVQANRDQKTGFWIFGKSVQIVTIKTMIYLLDSMNSELDPNIVSQILNLDINLWYDQWKSSIVGIRKLFKSGAIVDIDDGVLLCIKARLTLLQNFLRNTDLAITGNNILRSLETLTWTQYQSLKPSIKTPDDFYNKIDVKAYVKDPASGKYISSTTFSAIKSQTLTPEHLQKTCDLEPRYFDKIDFRYLDDEAQKFNLLLLESTAEKKGARFFRLNLSGCRFISTERLLGLLEKMLYLETLDISECGFTDKVLFDILKHRTGSFIMIWNHDVLCPQLKQLHYTSGGLRKTLAINLNRMQRQSLTRFILEVLSRQEKSQKNYSDALEYATEPWKASNYLAQGAQESRQQAAFANGEEKGPAYTKAIVVSLFALIAGPIADGVRWAVNPTVEKALLRLTMDSVSLELLLSHIRSLAQLENQSLANDTDMALKLVFSSIKDKKTREVLSLVCHRWRTLCRELREEQVVRKRNACLGFFETSDANNYQNSNSAPCFISGNKDGDKNSDWYSDDQINTLLPHYLVDRDVFILSCLLGTHWSGNNTLRDNLIQYNQRRAEAIMNRVAISNRIIIPVNLVKLHWVLVCIHFSNDQTVLPDIFYIDSLGDSVNTEVLSVLQDIFPDVEVITSEDIYFQDDSFNCGPWIIEIARFFSEHGSLPQPGQIDINAARLQHAEDLLLIHQAQEVNSKSL